MDVFLLLAKTDEQAMASHMRIVLPKTLCEVDPNHGPLFFLAGPGRGGGDWQFECCRESLKHLPNFYAALPCRYLPTHPLLTFHSPGVENYFDRQLTWERYYLELAGTSGCIIFWLPYEDTADPRIGSEPYAMDTRGELGEWRGRLIYDRNLRVVVGAEKDFPGLSQIERNFRQALKLEFPIYSTLADTVAAAVKKVR